MSKNYKRFLRNSGLVISEPDSKSVSHQKDINQLVHHKESMNLIALPGSATEEMTSTDGSSTCGSRQGTLKMQAARMMSLIESDAILMENDPLSEKLRVETLREMPQSLTLKRKVKARLTRAVSVKTKPHPIGCCRQFKYWISILFTRIRVQLRELVSGLELWYSSLKTIEGHFGSDVAAYFKFIRWFFIIDLGVLILSLLFVVVPQAISLEMLVRNASAPLGDVLSSMPIIVTNSPSFQPTDLLTGEGFLTNSTLYYGLYTNESVWGVNYSIPCAYLFTSFSSYLLIFVVLSLSMAKSYRKSFIETAGGVKNVYTRKVFCSWDFSIATENAANLKSESLFRDIKDLLDEDINAALNKRKLWQTLLIYSLRLIMNILTFVILIVSGLVIYSLLEKSLVHHISINTIHLTGYDILKRNGFLVEWQNEPVVISFIVTLLLVLLPILFSWIVRFENYDGVVSLYMTMLRTFILECIFVVVMVLFWLQEDSTQCWETSLGQQVYRLMVMDLMLSVAVTLCQFIRNGLRRTILKQLKMPEFDMSGNTLNLIYNQILFWVGFFFSPLLSLVIVVKLFLVFYLKKSSLLYNCESSKCKWRAAQTQTLVLILSFISLLVILITIGYIITSVHTSECGPFSGAHFMYEKMLQQVFHVQHGNSFWTLIMWLRRPGTVAGLLLTMWYAMDKGSSLIVRDKEYIMRLNLNVAGVYYLRAKSLAQKKMVKILREMLLTEAKDKEYLLQQISAFTGGRKTRLPSQTIS